MTEGVGRTYRYYTGSPLFRFGMGLSLTTFTLECHAVPTSSFHYSCTVTNAGPRGGDEVVQVYHSALNIGKVDHPLPRRALVNFARVHVPVGQAATVDFRLSRE